MCQKKFRSLKTRTILFQTEKAPLKTHWEACDSAPWRSGPCVPLASGLCHSVQRG